MHKCYQMCIYTIYCLILLVQSYKLTIVYPVNKLNFNSKYPNAVKKINEKKTDSKLIVFKIWNKICICSGKTQQKKTPLSLDLENSRVSDKI